MQRPRSLRLTLEGLPAEATVDGPVILRKEIYYSLKEGNIVVKTNDGIECFSKVLWFIVFEIQRQREAAKDKTLKLHNIEFHLESTKIERPTYMWSLKGNIPSFIFVGKYRIRRAYQGQRRTCRNCQQEGHETKDCQAGRVCKECGKPGHIKGTCPEKQCFRCQEKGHEANDCPQYFVEFQGLWASTGGPGARAETHSNGDTETQSKNPTTDLTTTATTSLGNEAEEDPQLGAATKEQSTRTGNLTTSCTNAGTPNQGETRNQNPMDIPTAKPKRIHSPIPRQHTPIHNRDSTIPQTSNKPPYPKPSPSEQHRNRVAP
ncbi:zinc finger CCHC domain-containing 3-like [Paramuricea clavata]|uniref:Zinc finger CCHC domain-containing 3-like n=1 Tax=Paramuricea clavata TaxID=317549 RepID=A0A7D9K7R8_PARCT|nr:zinc finger CCHC domain-containing 3-like [Paramuricea clavata]